MPPTPRLSDAAIKDALTAYYDDPSYRGPDEIACMRAAIRAALRRDRLQLVAEQRAKRTAHRAKRKGR